MVCLNERVSPIRIDWLRVWGVFFVVFCFPVSMLCVSFKESKTVEDPCSWNKRCWGLRESLAHAGIHSGVRQAPRDGCFYGHIFWASRPNSMFVITPGFIKSLDTSHHCFFLAHLWSLLNPPERLSTDFAFTVKKTLAIEKTYIFISGILWKILYELHTLWFFKVIKQ